MAKFCDKANKQYYHNFETMLFHGSIIWIVNSFFFSLSCATIRDEASHVIGFIWLKS